MTAALENRGRSIADIEVALFGAPADLEQAIARVDQGFTHIVFSLPQAEPDRVLSHLDKVAEIVDKLR